MNHKRKQPSNRKNRRACGYDRLGKDQIQKQIDKDHFNNTIESVNNFYKSFF